MWTLLGKEEEMAYVNMNMYPESNTGYGTSPNDAGVWQRIYKENCFTGPLNQACLEERVLFRLVSALHTSINTHVAYNYDRVLDNNNHTKAWKHNIDLYKRLVGNWPDRVKNLYFGYLFLLRAANKARPFLEQYRYNTGHPQEDEQVKQLMKKMLSAPLLCSPNFDESTLFTGPEKEQQKLKFKNHFRNISQIINCVTCEKCKTWAKLQLLGIGTALKILVDYDTDVVLERNEVIALVNTLRQFSDSITWIRVMSEQHDDKQISSTLDLLLSLARSFFSSPSGLVAVLPVVLVYVLRRQKTNKKATTTTTTTTTATTKTAKTTKTTNDGEHKKKT
jgi:ERO1-like protein alpha